VTPRQIQTRWRRDLGVARRHQRAHAQAARPSTGAATTVDTFLSVQLGRAPGNHRPRTTDNAHPDPRTSTASSPASGPERNYVCDTEARTTRNGYMAHTPWPGGTLATARTLAKRLRQAPGPKPGMHTGRGTLAKRPASTTPRIDTNTRQPMTRARTIRSTPTVRIHGGKPPLSRTVGARRRVRCVQPPRK
jgi:hypothetical protein